MDSVFASLLGSNTAPGVLSNLGAVGDKLGKTTDSWTKVLGQVIDSPAAPAAPAPSYQATVAASSGLSLSTIGAGIAAIALLAYLVIRGR